MEILVLHLVMKQAQMVNPEKDIAAVQHWIQLVVGTNVQVIILKNLPIFAFKT